MTLRFSLFAVLFSGALSLAGSLRAEEIEWTPEANMDHQLFPALLIATATVRPVEADDEQAEEPDPYLLGERFGLVGVSIKSPAANTRVKVTVKENEVMSTSSWSGELAEADKDYFIAPKVNLKFDRLRQMTQQVPLNVAFEVEVDGEPAGEKVETLQMRSINDCPFAVSNSEETVDDENVIAGSAELGWMFAAYVNENHPMLDKILQEALETKIVTAFRVTTHEHDETLKQVFAIWAALQKRGLQYSSTTSTPGGSETVQSQFIRFVDQTLAATQANCVDGSVLFASLLRKISIEPFLVTIPGHMYVGLYQDAALPIAIADRAGDRRRDRRGVGEEAEEQPGLEMAAAERQDVERRGRQQLECRKEDREAVAPHQEKPRREELLRRRGRVCQCACFLPSSGAPRPRRQTETPCESPAPRRPARSAATPVGAIRAR